jgi:Ion transport protein
MVPPEIIKFKIGDKVYTNRDIEFLNNWYDNSKKVKKDLSAMITIDIPHEPPCLHKVRKAVLPCIHFKADGEEDDDDWSVIVTPPYTSGESDLEIEAEFHKLSEFRQHQRMTELWHRLKVKALGGVRIIKRFAELSDNITMYGATRQIAVEIEEEIVPLPFILLPENKIRMGWNLVTLVLLLYTASFVPYRTSFIEYASTALTNWEWVVDALFSLDILINFISAYEDNDKNIEVRLKMIAKTYVSTWFMFDAVAIFPFQMLEG